jgi:hypothetical protein
MLDEALEAFDLRDEWVGVSVPESERLFHGAWIPQEGILLRAASRFSSRARGSAPPEVGSADVTNVLLSVWAGRYRLEAWKKQQLDPAG